MATIVGDALVWMLGNPDLLRLLAGMALGVGLIDSIFAIRDWMGGERP